MVERLFSERTSGAGTAVAGVTSSGRRRARKDKNYSRHDFRTRGRARGGVGECDDRLGRDPRVCSRGHDARGYIESSRFKGKVRRPSADCHSKHGCQNTFRKVPVDPDGAAAFGYVLGQYLIVDLRLQFGWRGSSGWRGVISAAIQYAQRITTRASASFSHAGDRAVEHVAIALSTGRPVASWPAECVVRPAEGGGADDPAFVVVFMDDAISVEVPWEKGCIDLSRSLTSFHFQAMGERGEGEDHYYRAERLRAGQRSRGC